MRLKPARPDMPVHSGWEVEGYGRPEIEDPRAHTARADYVPTPGAKRGAKKFSSIPCSFCRPSAAISTPAANAGLQGEGR